MLYRSIVIVLLNCLVLQKGIAQDKDTRMLLVVSKAEHVLALVDPQTLEVIAKIPVGPNPHEVIASADGHYAYVSNPGNSDMHEIDVIDLQARKALPAIDTRPLYGPHGLQYVDGKLWFTAQGSKAVGRIDTRTGNVEWSMGTGQDVTHMIYVEKDGRSFYTTNVQSGTVSIFNNVLLQPTVPPTGKLPPGAKPHMDWVQTLVPVKVGSEGFDVSPDGAELWTVSDDGIASIIDVKKKLKVDSIDTKMLGAHRMKFTPDGKYVAIVSVRTGQLMFFDVNTRQVVKELKMDQGATMLMDPVNGRLFVSCPLDANVTIVDLKTMSVTGRLNVGGRPDGLAFSS